MACINDQNLFRLDTKYLTPFQALETQTVHVEKGIHFESCCFLQLIQSFEATHNFIMLWQHPWKLDIRDYSILFYGNNKTQQEFIQISC